MGCEDCHRKRRVQPGPTEAVVVTVKKPASSMLWYLTGLALGWYARGLFDV
jgi:hypothetical protein